MTGLIKFLSLVAILNGLSVAAAMAQNAWKKVMEQVVLVNAFPGQVHASTLVELDSVSLMMAWFGGTHEGNNDVVIWTARLVNGHWSRPVPVADGVQDSGRFATWNPVLFKDASGTIHLFYKVGPNPRDWWGMVKTSNNHGRSWSAPKRLPKGMLGPIKNKPIQLKDGSILSPSSTETETAWRAHIERSTDGGRTWTYIPIDTAGPYDVIQPSLLTFSDGRLQVLCRSKQGYVMQSSSSDEGMTWSKLKTTSLINPNSGTDAISLHDGSHLIVYNPDVPGREWWNGRSRLHVAISIDGSNWTDIAILEHHDSGEYSYPSVLQSRDGRVHISYTCDRKNIKYVILEKK